MQLKDAMPVDKENLLQDPGDRVLSGPLERRQNLPRILMAALVCLLLGRSVYQFSFNHLLEHERSLAVQRLDAVAQSLETTLARHESLPALLALDPNLAALLRNPQDARYLAAANAYLEAAQQGAGLAAAYLINIKGVTLAASNWRQPRSFVGQDYSFRPYFRDAMSTGFGRFYGVGVTTGEAGYFLAGSVRDAGAVVGVVVIKISLDNLEHSLLNGSDRQMLADADGIVFLASDHGLRYRSLARLDEALQAQLQATRQYGAQLIEPLADRPIELDQRQLSRLAIGAGAPAREYLVQARPLGRMGWQLIQLGDPAEARVAAWAAAWASGMTAALIIGLAAYLRQRARRREELRLLYDQLEARIAERTAELRDKVAALERTEAILRETRDSAVQAGKLAVLGQMSAGISHELNQPLAAMQTLADNAAALLARNRVAEVTENLTMIRDLIGRAGSIVRHIKVFARKESAQLTAVNLQAVVQAAIWMVEPRRRELQAEIVILSPLEGLQVLADAGRLEQVLVNLLRNGLDAMENQALATVPGADSTNPATNPAFDRQLQISASVDAAWITLQIRDFGAGLTEAEQARLFEPFFTTKPSGKGLGLGLAISQSIVEGFGGSLSGRNALGGGAKFVVKLPLANAASPILGHPQEPETRGYEIGR